MVQPHGPFVLVHVSTPLEVCETRDRKGLYAKARAGIIQQFTGISDPYEAPECPELTLPGDSAPPEKLAERVVEYLIAQGKLGDAHRRKS